MSTVSPMKMGEAFRGELVVHRRDHLELVRPLLVYLGVVVGAIAWAFLHVGFDRNAAGAILLLLVLWPLVTWSKFRGKLEPRGLADIVIDAQGIFVNGSLAVPRQRIVGGDFVRNPGRIRVMARFGISLLHLEVDKEEVARRLLAALAIEGSLACFTIASPLRGPVLAHARLVDVALLASMAAAGLGVLTSVRFLYFQRLFYASLAALAPLVLYAWPASATVGDEGIVVRWLFSRSYVAFSSVSGIDRHGMTVRLHRKDGSVYLLRTDEESAPASASPLFARARAAFEKSTFAGALATVGNGHRGNLEASDA